MKINFINLKMKSWLLCLCCLGAGTTVAQTRYYVQLNVTGANNGTSWNNAFSDLQNAINAANTGDEIWVAAGTYKPLQFVDATYQLPQDKTFYLNKNIKIYGGFSATETSLAERNSTLNVTTLSGDLNGDDVVTSNGATLTFTNNADNVYHVMITQNLTSEAVIDGFTIKGGNAAAQQGRVLSIYGAAGGAIYNGNSSPTIKNCKFIENKALSYGGSICNWVTSSPILSNCLFSQSAGEQAGAVYNYSQSSPRFTNCAFTQNFGSYAGAIYAQYLCSLEITNCSFKGNVGSGGAIYNHDGSIMSVRNSILWDNGSNEVHAYGNQPTFQNSIVKGSGGSSNWNTSFGLDSGNNLDTDPMFVNNFLELRVVSPAVNAGNNSFNSTNTDLGGNQRIQGGTIDIGAQERLQRTFPTGLPTCLETDFRQLEILYDETNGDNWKSHTNWFTANMATWQGIRLTASGCDIDSIGLISNHLVGVIPSFNLPQLKRLFLFDNQLSGTIPNFRQTSLVSLQLSKNQFTGAIPNFNLPQLGYLQLSYNQLTGTIPNFDSTRLNWLSLGFNQLTGAIPNFNLAFLTTVQLNNNQLSGALPIFNQCPQLTQINIANNRFTFDKLPNLVTSRAWNPLQYAPQDSFYQETTYNPYRGSSLHITLGIDPNENGNLYEWYKGGQFIRSTQNRNYIDLERLVPADAGDYTCKVTNPSAPNLTLWSRVIHVNVLTTAIVQGGTRSDLLCGSKDYRLPSGRIVNYPATHQDTLRHIDATPDTIYTIVLRADSSCRCVDSIAIAGMVHTSGGFPAELDLNQPMSNWTGFRFNNEGCITSWVSNKPDSVKCMALGGNTILQGDFHIFELVNSRKKWYKSNNYFTDGNPLMLNGFQRRDTARYVCMMEIEAGEFALIPTLRTIKTQAYSVKLCCKDTTVTVQKTILAGNCVRWGNSDRCVTGIYRDTIFGEAASGCDSIRVLNLKVVSCNLTVNIAQIGNGLKATVVSASKVPIRNYRWSNGVIDTNYIAIQSDGVYSVTVTDALGCSSIATINAILDASTKFRTDSAQVSCAGSGYTHILFTQMTRNATGYTVYVTIDNTKVRPDIEANHRYKYRMPSPDSCKIYQTVSGNQLTLTFLPTSSRLMQANVGDTLLSISWLSVSAEISANPTLLKVVIDESIQNTGRTTYLANSQIRIVGSGFILERHFNDLNGTVQFHTTTPALNPTIVRNGTPNQMYRVSYLDASGISVFSPKFGNYVGFYRQSLPDFGMPDIGNYSAYLLKRLIAGDTTLSAHQLIKADVDGNSALDVEDLRQILYRANHPISGFVQANTSLHPKDTMSWRTYPVSNDPAFNAANMRYVDANGVVRYRIPKIDTIMRIPDIYLNRCDTLTRDYMHAQLGNIQGNPSNQQRKPLNSQIVFGLSAQKDTNQVWMIPIYAKECVVNGLDIKMDGFNMEILGVDLAHPNLTMDAPFIDNAHKICVFGCYATNNVPVVTNNPIAYLRARIQENQLSTAHLGAFKAYLNAQLVNGIISGGGVILYLHLLAFTRIRH
jgi:hypothetical protein